MSKTDAGASKARSTVVEVRRRFFLQRRGMIALHQRWRYRDTMHPSCIQDTAFLLTARDKKAGERKLER